MNRSALHPYLDALKAMHHLLDALGEHHWSSWISEDIDEWENHRSTQHHISAYGGMGSFNDMAFDDVWLATLFDDLKSSCYYFAHHVRDKPDIASLERSMGNHGFELGGWRCLVCGYGVVSSRSIDYFIARRIIRQRILAAAEHTQLRELVDSVIRSRPVDKTLTTERVANWIEESGLHIRDSNDWVRPCPSCGSDNTAVFGWLPSNESIHPFAPAPWNLSLQNDVS
jgi:hypothetical protein